MISKEQVDSIFTGMLHRDFISYGKANGLNVIRAEIGGSWPKTIRRNWLETQADAYWFPHGDQLRRRMYAAGVYYCILDDEDMLMYLMRWT